jgi:hypothetical protein
MLHARAHTRPAHVFIALNKCHTKHALLRHALLSCALAHAQAKRPTRPPRVPHTRYLPKP